MDRDVASQTVGAPKSGLTKRLLASIDGLGNRVSFVLLPGYCHDTVGVVNVIQDLHLDGLIAVKGVDVNRIVKELDAPRQDRDLAAPATPRVTRDR